MNKTFHSHFLNRSCEILLILILKRLITNRDSYLKLLSLIDKYLFGNKNQFQNKHDISGMTDLTFKKLNTQLLINLNISKVLNAQSNVCHPDGFLFKTVM